MLAQDYPRFEIVAMDDGSTDRTAAEIAARVGDSRLTAPSCPSPPAGWLGKPHALFQGGNVLATGLFLGIIYLTILKSALAMESANLTEVVNV